MSETAVEMRVRWVCGKCRGGSLYREDNPLAGDTCIVCPTCGNRHYHSIGRQDAGAAPVKVLYTPRPAPAEPTGPRPERSANILIGPMLLAAARPAAVERILEIIDARRAGGQAPRDPLRRWRERIQARAEARATKPGGSWLLTVHTGPGAGARRSPGAG